ncbi:MAG: hypothetical protein AAF430_06960 [Myxococcota bacterium]
MECTRCSAWFADYMAPCPFCHPPPRFVPKPAVDQAFLQDTGLAHMLRQQKHTRSWAPETKGISMRLLAEAITFVSEKIWRDGLGPAPVDSRGFDAGPVRIEASLRHIVAFRLGGGHGRTERIWESKAYYEVAGGEDSHWLAALRQHDLCELLTCVGVIATYSQPGRSRPQDDLLSNPVDPVNAFRLFTRHLAKGDTEGMVRASERILDVCR